MNIILENISNTIFRHWFLDFEFPNNEDKPYQSKGGKTVYNEKLGKEIPINWEVSTIQDLADSIKYGYTMSASLKSIGPI